MKNILYSKNKNCSKKISYEILECEIIVLANVYFCATLTNIYNIQYNFSKCSSRLFLFISHVNKPLQYFNKLLSSKKNWKVFIKLQ